MSEQLCEDNSICCDDNCTKCANRIYEEYIKLKTEIEKLHKSKMDFADEFEYLVLHEDVEVAKHKCRDYESYINGAEQFRFQVKNLIRKAVARDEKNKSH